MASSRSSSTALWSSFACYLSVSGCTQPNPAFDPDESESEGPVETSGTEQGTGETETGGETDSDTEPDPEPKVCGNRVVDPGEECDDGNFDSSDGCLDSCRIPRSCAEILAHEPDAATGTYAIDPMDSGAPWSATCDMDLEGGGWTGFTVEDLLCDEHLGNEVVCFVGEQYINFADCQLFVVMAESGGVFECYWDVDFPPGFHAFFLRDYVVKAIGTPELNFVQVEWSQAAVFPNGALSFGSASDLGPITTWLGESGEGGFFTDGETKLYPVLDDPWELAQKSNQLRIGFGEYGQMLEGFYPWWAGRIFVR